MPTLTLEQISQLLKDVFSYGDPKADDFYMRCVLEATKETTPQAPPIAVEPTSLPPLDTVYWINARVQLQVHGFDYDSNAMLLKVKQIEPQP